MLLLKSDAIWDIVDKDRSLKDWNSIPFLSKGQFAAQLKRKYYEGESSPTGQIDIQYLLTILYILALDSCIWVAIKTPKWLDIQIKMG
jgi:hypothetical protein